MGHKACCEENTKGFRSQTLQEDYVTGLKYGLPIHSPVDDDGKFSGLDVLGGGNVAVIEYLDEHMSIIMNTSIHMTKKPTIFRATEQWFASVEGFREAAMDAISQVTFLSQVIDPLLPKILPLYVIMQNPSLTLFMLSISLVLYLLGMNI
ncbi:hypothetical protein LOK49_LG08G03205 [Camellia lanceoleosa]|uniref:Uncharacterized protein n=1 Tax=Camellia lanceoleosa TaxID=1840588 RepID=A0ACC0GRJ7_9ERIC|nr:hypothetical protein LOK49_LG08G03205 [Camellia lanceoleosa]